MVAGNKLDPATAFTSIWLLHVVAQSLNELPMIGMHLMRAKVSLDRIAEFLEEEELEKYDDDDDDDDDVNNANDHRSRDQTSAADSVDISESTPLLITDDGNSIVQIRLNPETELPPDYVKPEVGFYAGKFIHYGAPETSPSTFDAASAANDKKKMVAILEEISNF